jgi:hypothetical protein
MQPWREKNLKAVTKENLEMLGHPQLAGMLKRWGGDGPLRPIIQSTICGGLLPACDGRTAHW